MVLSQTSGGTSSAGNSSAPASSSAAFKKLAAKAAAAVAALKTTTSAASPTLPTTTAAANPAKPTKPTKPTTTTATKTSSKADHAGKDGGVHVITKIVVKKVDVTPDVPAGAFMPSKHQVLALTNFKVAGGNIGCSLSGAGVRCAILQKAWTGPRQPSTCAASWGSAINLLGKGYAGFACGGMATPAADAKVVTAGSDDKIGQFTCQVRTFGVDCFAADRRGFFISRTGYAIY